MKTFFFFFHFLVFSCFVKYSYSQNYEFLKHQNGLIYSENTINNLKYIVDSLNLKFKKCDSKSIFFSNQIGKGHGILFNKLTPQIVKDIKLNISFNQLQKKHSNIKYLEDIYVVNYEDEYEGISINSEGMFPRIESLEKEGWVIEKTDENKYLVFFVEIPLKSQKLTNKYSEMIEYTHCVIDTNTQIFNNNAIESGVRFYNDKQLPKVQLFLDYINDFPNKPILKELGKKPKKMKSEDWYEKEIKEMELFNSKFFEWDSLRSNYIENTLSKLPEFHKLLKNSVKEALDSSSSNAVLEYYCEKYKSNKEALLLKRNRIVVGGCSQDPFPRIHAKEIALLAAETTSWEIFLRSHLDIMNDNFKRASDGSYALKGRGTYIKELEELNFNIPDLMIGICFRFANAPKNHYYGNISRIGRAIAESKYRFEIEKKILEIIMDEECDLNNRYLMSYLIGNYAFSVDSENDKKVILNKTFEAIKTLPCSIEKKLIDDFKQ